MWIRTLIALCSTLMLAGASANAMESGRPDRGWVASWTASPHRQAGDLQPLSNVTVRSFAPSSIGGGRVRVRLSNEYGSKPLLIGAASVGIVDAAGRMRPDSLRTLTFGGAGNLLVPAAAPALADPVDLQVQAGDMLAVSLYLPQDTLPETYHRWLPNQDLPAEAVLPPARIAPGGDATRQSELPESSPYSHLFVAGVDVLQPRARGVVAVMGTTRTDGPGRWPEFLAPRLHKAGQLFSVVNASMVANPLTRPYPNGGDAGLARFDRDVLALPGLTHVVIADAINDIGQVGSVFNGRVMVDPSEAPTLEQLAAAYLQLASRARARGARIIVATLLPFEGVPFAGFYSAEKEQLRGDLNQWLRANSKSFDGLIDLDAIMRDPANPLRFRPGLHTANNFAPNDAGERRIAESIDLRLFR